MFTDKLSSDKKIFFSKYTLIFPQSSPKIMALKHKILSCILPTFITICYIVVVISFDRAIVAFGYILDFFFRLTILF